FLGQLARAAMRTLRSFPGTRTNQDFALLIALLTMKFVNRHGEKNTRTVQKAQAGSGAQREGGAHLEPQSKAAGGGQPRPTDAGKVGRGCPQPAATVGS